jgi:hypothetical protein
MQEESIQSAALLSMTNVLFTNLLSNEGMSGKERCFLCHGINRVLNKIIMQPRRAGRWHGTRPRRSRAFLLSPAV